MATESTSFVITKRPSGTLSVSVIRSTYERGKLVGADCDISLHSETPVEFRHRVEEALDALLQDVENVPIALHHN